VAEAAVVAPAVVVAVAIVEDVGIVVIITVMAIIVATSHSELATQNLPACLRTCGEPCGQPANERVSEPFFGHTALNVRDVVRQLFRQIVHSTNERVGINSQLFGLSAPVTELDIAETVFAPELH
jgi:hypothetical protein